jgi:multicomponent Na+:H+ antiporter subunit D
VSHIGLTLVGIALLVPTGVGGAVLYAVADGMVKAALFVLAGILAHRFGTLHELELRGQGRREAWLAPLLVLGAVGLAGVPPFGTFVGKALIEEAAGDAWPWVAALFTVASALTASAVLRVTGRVFAGWGPVSYLGGEDVTAEQERGTQESELHVPRAWLGPSLLLPALGLLAGALVVGVIPGLSTRADQAAARFTDRPAYAATVLEGAAEPLPQPVEPAPERLLHAAPWSAGTLLLAVPSRR